MRPVVKFHPEWKYFVADDMPPGHGERPVPGLPVGDIDDFAVRSDGTVAVLSRGSVQHGSLGEGFVPVVDTEGRSESVKHVRHIAWFGQDLYLGGPLGLYRVSSTGERETLSSHEVTSLYSDRSGRLWVGGHESLRCIHSSGEVAFRFEEESKGAVRVVHIGADGAVYCVRDGGDVFRLAPGEESVFRLLPMDSTVVGDVLVQEDGTLWSATPRASGAASFSSGGVRVLRPNGGCEQIHLFRSADTILPRIDGRVVVLSEGRLWTFHQRRWAEERVVGTGSTTSHYTLRRGPGATLWISTPQGFGVWSPGSPERGGLSTPLGRAVALWDRSTTPLKLAEAGLVPVLRIGWADGRFDKREVSELERQLSTMGHPAASSVAHFCNLMTIARPSEPFFDDLRLVVGAMLRAATEDERLQGARRVIGLAKAMAEASGGFLGFGDPICKAERALLKELAAVLEVEEEL